MAEKKKFYHGALHSAMTIYLCRNLADRFYCMGVLPCLYVVSETEIKVFTTANFKSEVQDLQNHLIIYEGGQFSLIDMNQLSITGDELNSTSQNKLRNAIGENLTEILTQKCSFVLTFDGPIVSIAIDRNPLVLAGDIRKSSVFDL